MYIEYCYGPKWPYLIYVAYIGLFGTGICRSVQVLYLGRAPRTKETLPDFREKCRVTRHSRVFRGLTGSQRTPGFWGVTKLVDNESSLWCVILRCRTLYGFPMALIPGPALLDLWSRYHPSFQTFPTRVCVSQPKYQSNTYISSILPIFCRFFPQTIVDYRYRVDYYRYRVDYYRYAIYRQ